MIKACSAPTVSQYVLKLFIGKNLLRFVVEFSKFDYRPDSPTVSIIDNQILDKILVIRISPKSPRIRKLFKYLIPIQNGRGSNLKLVTDKKSGLTWKTDRPT